MMKLIAPGGNRIRPPTRWVDYTRHLQSETAAALQGGGCGVGRRNKRPVARIGLVRSPISFFCVGLGPFERLFISLPLLLSLFPVPPLPFDGDFSIPRRLPSRRNSHQRPIIPRCDLPRRRAPSLPPTRSPPLLSELIPGADLEFASFCSHEEWDRRGWDGTQTQTRGEGERERAGQRKQGRRRRRNPIEKWR